MIIIKFDLVLFIIFHVSRCERRIIGGVELTEDKTYVAYLVKAAMSIRKYDTWLCGGAIVSAEFIITSAACVEDVRYMYAVAGYRRYLNDENIREDDCFKNMKKKVVYTCVPVSYELNYKEIDKWSYVDIALVKVESPYDFQDARYQIICSYIPSVIPINFDDKHQKAGVDAIVMGWGHTEHWRKLRDHENYNQDFLNYGSTIIMDQKKCVEEYQDYPNMRKVIQKYMICTNGSGRLNEHGVLRPQCVTVKEKMLGKPGPLCEGEIITKKPVEHMMLQGKLPIKDDTRKYMSLEQTSNVVTDKNVYETNIMNRTSIVSRTDILNRTNIVNRTDIMNRTSIAKGSDSISRTDFIYKPGFGNISGFFNRSYSRRSGICQNDHGGPLVAWVGKTEVLIGVASVFRIDNDRKCIGPFLFTSTYCSGAFINCVLHENQQDRGLRTNNATESLKNLQLCDTPPDVKGFDTIESHVSWKDHPDGPAQNELLEAKFVQQDNK